MNIPIVFTFDNNLVDPAIVCFTSLLENKKENTFYDIHILYIDLEEKNREKIQQAFPQYSNYSISFMDVSSEFDFSGGFEIRGITITAYLRLLIPRVLKHLPKVIYSDVDVIFLEDMTELFEYNLEKKVAGVNRNMSSKENAKYLADLGVGERYINSGILIFNNERICEDDVLSSLALIERKYIFQDQDVINVVYAEEIDFNIHPKYCYTPEKVFSLYLQDNEFQNTYFKEQLDDLKKMIHIVHHSGPKPWNNVKVIFSDLWWEYYRKSSIYDFGFYLNKQGCSNQSTRSTFMYHIKQMVKIILQKLKLLR